MEEAILLAAKAVGAALAVLPLLGVGLAIGNIFANAIASISRNPESRDTVFPIVILGFALTEAVGLFALVISFLILFT